jgi:hypothetical protein
VAGVCYHVTSGKPIYRDDRDRRSSLGLPAGLPERFGTRLHAYGCGLPNWGGSRNRLRGGGRRGEPRRLAADDEFERLVDRVPRQLLNIEI